MSNVRWVVFLDKKIIFRFLLRRDALGYARCMVNFIQPHQTLSVDKQVSSFSVSTIFSSSGH